MELATSSPLPEPDDGLPADFRALYDAHVDFVWRNLRALGVAQADLEDATQETFVVAYRRRHDFRPNASMRGWLYGIARRIAYRQRRGQGRRTRLHGALSTDPRPTAVPPPSLELLDARRAMDHFLDGLPDPQREVFVLAELEELSGREIADVVGVNPNTAGSRLRAARASFDRFVEVTRARERGDELRRTGLRSDGPTEQQRRRVAGLLAANLGQLGTTASVATSTATSLPFWSTALGAEIKVFVVIAVVGVASIVGLDRALPPASGDGSDDGASARQDPSAISASLAPAGRQALAGPRQQALLPPPQQPTAPQTPVVVAPPPAAGPAVEPSKNRAASVGPAKLAAEPAPSSADALAAEASLVSSMRTALSHDPGRALGLAETHARRFPGGTLKIEVQTLKVRALCAVGQPARAIALAKTLTAAAPQGPAAAVARSGCPAAAENNPTRPDAAGEEPGV